jgi:hypothetical protein
MAAGSTYTPIATTTLGSAAASYTFSSIPSTYTDLVLVMNTKGSTSNYCQLRFNSDTGTNYSRTDLKGNGSTAASSRDSNRSIIDIASNATNDTSNFNTNIILHIMNYANTTTYKTAISRANNAATGTDAIVVLWRSTSAINSIYIAVNTGNLEVGTTLTLYGIAAA